MGCYLVTGAAGFIGAAIAQRLLVGGNQVVTIDNLSTGYINNIPPGTEFIEADCQDPKIYPGLADRHFDAIYHIAGQSSGEISFDDPVYDLDTNAASTLRLLRLAKEIGCTQFIYAGTMSVYGRCDDRAISEEESCSPESFYGVGKLASEHYMRIWQAQYEIACTSLRLFNVYGPGQNMANLRQGMVSIFMAQMLESGRVLVKGSPQRFRDFIYIDDVVDAFMACLDNKKASGQIINVATGIRTTIGELLEHMSTIYGGTVDIEISGNTSGDIHGIYGANQRLTDLLGITPRVMLDEGLRRMMISADT